MKYEKLWLCLLACLLLEVVAGCGPGRRTGGGGDDDDSAGDDDDSAGEDDDSAATGSADILFVIDNSNSMAFIHQELQAAFPTALLDELVFGGLDFQIGVTTTDLDSDGNGNMGNIRSSGSLGGSGCQEPAVLTPDSGDIGVQFASLVDVGISGSGNESGIWATAVAMCKGKDATWWSQLDDLPNDDPTKVVCSLVPENERECNAGFFRPDTTSVVIVVSDEGDATERLEFLPPPTTVSDCMQENAGDPSFGECDCRLAWWMEFFDGIGPSVRFATIGPTYQAQTDEFTLCDGSTISYPGPCNPFGSTTCSIDFYQEAACLSGGLFMPNAATDNTGDPMSCEVADFGAIATQLRDLLGSI